MKLLKELYDISAPSRKEKQMRKFICAWLKERSIEFTTDKTKNIYVTKGRSSTYPCIVAHLDEVHSKRSKDFTVINTGDLIFGFDIRQNKFCGIGADDKNGIWVCLKCLEEFDALKCAFFVGEEIGCAGSSRAEMAFFDDCRFVLQCDRKGNSDLIRWAGMTELCSDEFISAVNPGVYGYKIMNGMMTDVQSLKQQGLKVSCANISCGYYNPHMNTELTRWSDLNKCLGFVRHIIGDCTGVFPHKYTPPVRYRDCWASDGWPFRPIANTGNSRERQLSELRRRMARILFYEPHLSLDEVSDRIGDFYDKITLSELQDLYIELANKSLF